jgi:adhesin/invasin
VPGFNCAPSNVNFLQPGQSTSQNGNPYNGTLSGVQVCGIEGYYAPLSSLAVDADYDDPYGLNGGGGTTEGNYPDSQSIQFTPASGTSLGGGDSITVGLPQPAEPYADSGSILPPPEVGDYADSEQADSTVSVIDSFTSSNTEYAVVEVSLANGWAGDTVRLDAFNPYNPPSLRNGPGPQVSGNTSASISYYDTSSSTFKGGNTVVTDSSGDAYFEVTDGANQTVVFAATDVTSSNSQFWVGLQSTATFPFNAGGGSGPCASDLSSPLPSGSTDGLTYLIVENNVGYLVPDVDVSSSAGVESATLTVPSGVPATTNQVTVVVLDTITPPGGGTPSNQLASPNTPYPPDDFSISSSEDPVPGFPNNAPVLQADANGFPSYLTSDGLLPVDPFTSTMTSSSPTQQVGGSGATETATLNDLYNNPVNDKPVSIYQSSPTHASVAPETAPTSSEYPLTSATGTVSYDVSDSCAETVSLTGVDAAPDNTVINQQGEITFTPGPPVAPDGSTTPANCGKTPVQSSIVVSSATEPADGETSATVTVTLGDQFGNADACQQVNLSNGANPISHANIIPQLPASPCSGSQGPTGPGYTGTNGVATFLVSDSSVELATLGVTDSTDLAVWPTNASTHPLDVAQITFEAPDALASTVTANPGTGPADNQPASTVTVSLNDAASQPEQGKSVTLKGCTNATGACIPDSTTTITAIASVTTGTPPAATFEVADNSTVLPHPVYYQATDTTDGVTLASRAEVIFTEGGASLSASPTTVIADSNGSSTLTFTLQSTTGNPLENVPVSVSANPSAGASISAGTTTDANGMANFTVSDTQAGTVILKATSIYQTTLAPCVGILNGTTCTVTAVTTVTFISPPNTFTVTASPATGVPADGETASQVTVTALALDGTPIAGLPLELLTNGNAVAGPPTTTGSNGQASFPVTDATPQTVDVSAEYGEVQAGGGIPSTWYPAPGCPTFPPATAPTTCTGTVQFVATEAEASTITAAPPSAPADGVSAVTVTVNLQSGAGTALTGHSVVLFTGSATTNVLPSPTTNVGATTNGSGHVSFTITDTQAETLNVYARDENTGTIVNQVSNGGPTLTVTFTRTEADASTVSASPSSELAGGAATTVTVTLIGGNGLPLTGKSVSLTTGSTTTTVSPPSAVTNAAGQAFFSVSDSAVETIHIGAVDTTDGITLASTATVSFIQSEKSQSIVSITPASLPAAETPATLTVTLLNGTGGAIGDELVTVPAVGHATVTPLVSSPGYAAGYTNAIGQAQFAVADGTPETVTLTAFDGSTELDQTATVTFRPDEASQSSVSASPSSLGAYGPATTVTVTLRTGANVLIVGDSVTLSSNSSTTVITPATVKSNSAGKAVFTVTDNCVQSGVVLTAKDTTTGITIFQTAIVNFVANEANQSTTSATPSIQKVGKVSVITVTLLGPTDAPLVGHKATLSTGSKTTVVTDISKGGVTNSAGVIQFDVIDFAPQVISISVTDTTTGVTLYEPLLVYFT